MALTCLKISGPHAGRSESGSCVILLDNRDQLERMMMGGSAVEDWEHNDVDWRNSRA